MSTAVKGPRHIRKPNRECIMADRKLNQDDDGVMSIPKVYRQNFLWQAIMSKTICPVGNSMHFCLMLLVPLQKRNLQESS